MNEEPLIGVCLDAGTDRARHANVPEKHLRYAHEWQAEINKVVVWSSLWRDESGRAIPMPPPGSLDTLWFIEMYYLGDEVVKRAPHGLLLKGQAARAEHGQLGG